MSVGCAGIFILVFLFISSRPCWKPELYDLSLLTFVKLSACAVDPWARSWYFGRIDLLRAAWQCRFQRVLYTATHKYKVYLRYAHLYRDHLDFAAPYKFVRRAYYIIMVHESTSGSFIRIIFLCGAGAHRWTQYSSSRVDIMNQDASVNFPVSYARGISRMIYRKDWFLLFHLDGC